MFTLSNYYRKKAIIQSYKILKEYFITIGEEEYFEVLFPKIAGNYFKIYSRLTLYNFAKPISYLIPKKFSYYLFGKIYSVFKNEIYENERISFVEQVIKKRPENRDYIFIASMENYLNPMIKIANLYPSNSALLLPYRDNKWNAKMSELNQNVRVFYLGDYCSVEESQDLEKKYFNNKKNIVNIYHCNQLFNIGLNDKDISLIESMIIPKTKTIEHIMEEFIKLIKPKRIYIARQRRIFDSLSVKIAKKLSITSHMLIHGHIGNQYKFVLENGLFSVDNIYYFLDGQKKAINNSFLTINENVNYYKIRYYQNNNLYRFDPDSENIIIFVDNNYKSEYSFLISILKVLQKTKNIKIHIKLHPGYRGNLKEKSKSFNQNNIFISYNFSEKSYRFAISNISTINLDLFADGLPVIIHAVNYKLNFHFIKKEYKLNGIRVHKSLLSLKNKVNYLNKNQKNLIDFKTMQDKTFHSLISIYAHDINNIILRNP